MAGMISRSTEAAGLGTAGARYTLILVWVLGIWSTLMENPIESVGFSLIAIFALQLISLLIITIPGNAPLSFFRGLICTISAISAGVLSIQSVVPPENSWPFNFSTYLLALLSIRGNLRESLGGGAVLTFGTFAFLFGGGASLLDIVAFLALPLVAFCVGIIWRIAISSAVAREHEYLATAARAQLAAATARTATARDQKLINEVRKDAVPVLNSIIRGDFIGDPEALKISVVQEDIRDRIRSPQLRHPSLRSEVTKARLRGVRVTLLGNDSVVVSQITEPLARAIGALISQVEHGSITIRSDPSQTKTAFSVLVSTDSSTRRYVLDAAGSLLE